MLERFQKELWKFTNSYSESIDSEVNKLVDSFVNDYSPEKIKNLTLLEYAGKVEEGRSFSYRLEFETKIVGNISGQSGIDKFGVFKKGKKYKHTNRYGDNLEEAFFNVKNEILQVIDASKNCDYDTISNSMLAPLIKYKLAYMYNQTEFLSVFSKKHLQRCVNNIFGANYSDKYSEIELQKILLEEKNNFHATADWSNYKFSKCIYDIFGLKDNKLKNNWSLEKEIEVNTGILESFDSQSSYMVSGKIDYLSEHIHKCNVGLYGEQLVLKYEKEKLENLGKKELSDKVTQVSLNDDSLGYDILSFDENGNEKYIEVKTTRGTNKYFYITENELNKANKLDGYMMYLVSDVLNNDKIQLDILSSNAINSRKLTPIIYKGKVK
ncbi:DUF3883 domain-containing protein [Vagococcus lutrae]|uniref:DUF3883 domain-containing protein n=2 Tax=Vagococcus lutrae TaxID=81947 RepID=UPI001C949D92|nr:DUF3883 domain-containing protein [Vagococcus lutrae]QZN88986.1 DUF3883 domain-containing protein [Vagococcus lutrae]